MKYNLKSKIFSFLLGAILFGDVGVLAGTMLAEDISFHPVNDNWQVNNIGEALDDLYDKVKPEYNGITQITPTTSTQTLYTKDKILNNNIIVSAIPSTYKNLSTNTTVSANNLLKGYTAYDNNGNLITGNISSSCISSTLKVTTECTTTTGCDFLDFEPASLSLYVKNDTASIWYYNKELNEWYVFYYSNSWKNSGTSIAVSDRLKINKTTKLVNLTSSLVGKNIYYMACK